MKILYNISNVNRGGKILQGWTIIVKKSEPCNEYQTELYYKDGNIYWISQVSRELQGLVDETIDKIEWIVDHIPEDALNSNQQWSHVKSFGNFKDREFIMLLKCNGEAELQRFQSTSAIFNHSTNFIPDSTDMLDENWSGALY